MDNLNRKVINAIIFNYIGKYGQYILSFFFSIYFVRELSQDSFGIWNLYIVSFKMLVGFSALGFPSLIQRYIPEFISGQEYKNLKTTIYLSFTMRIILLLILLVILYFFRYWFGSTIKIPDFSNIVFLFCFICLIRCINSNSVLILNALIKHKHRNIIQLAGYIIQIILFIYVLEEGGGIFELLWAFMISSLFHTVFYVVVLMRLHSKSSKVIKSYFPIKEFTRFGFFGMFREFGDIVFSNISDIYIITTFLNPVSVAIYSLALKVVNTGMKILPINIGSNAIRPAFFSKYDKTKDEGFLLYGFNFFNKISAFMVFPLVVYFLIFSSNMMIYIYGVKYIDSDNIIRILIVFSMSSVFGVPLGLVLIALKHIEISFYARIFTIYNILMAILLINYLGLTGVALATGTAILFKYIFMFFCLRKYIKLEYKMESFLKPFINSSVLFMIMFVINMFIQSLLGLIIVSVCYPFVYLLISYINKVFKSNEADIINRAIGKKLVRF